MQVIAGCCPGSALDLGTSRQSGMAFAHLFSAILKM